MIKSFADEDTEQAFHGIYTHGIRRLLPNNLMKMAERRLDILNCAENMDSLKTIPLFKEECVRDSHGEFSIPIEGNLRIVFRWDHEGPFDVQIKS